MPSVDTVYVRTRKNEPVNITLSIDDAVVFEAGRRAEAI